MCRILGVTRSLVYYKHKRNQEEETALEKVVIRIFRESRNNYGTRKIKYKLEKENIILSRRKIGTIMKKYGLVSNYTVKQYKVYRTKCNEEKIENEVARKFNNRRHLEVVVSDLTYVKVNDTWNYVCILLNLANREIIGYSAGKNKNASLVYDAFMKVEGNLKDIEIFHTDRGNEFKNKLIEDVLETFEIKRSLSKKGCPYDNAVAEAAFKVIKTEFAFNKVFKSLDELKMELFDYVNWYNNHRIHGALNYKTPVECRPKKTE